MGSEDLDQTNLQSWDFAVHENTSKIELDLKTDVDVGTVNGRTPPEREPTVGNLVQTGTLRVRQLLVPH